MVGVGQQTSSERLDAHQWEILFGDLQGRHALGRFATGDINVVRFKERDLFEDVTLVAPIGIVGVGNARSADLALRIFADRHRQLRTVLERQRPVEHRVHGTEDRYGATDADGQRPHRNGSERRTPAEHRRRVPDVLPHGRHRRSPRGHTRRFEEGSSRDRLRELLAHAPVVTQFVEGRTPRIVVAVPHRRSSS